ncbi:MAG TPA: membrane protein insertase YidC [Cyclobacteriaceae bacterium]|nr:membrane protein insertase YidC [Cyclobacteriaceae bacterium]
MDKNQVTGLVLISLLLFIYIYFFAPKPSQTPAVQESAESIDSVSRAGTVKDNIAQISVKNDSIVSGLSGDYAKLFSGIEKEIRISTRDAVYTFSTRGGSIKDVTLNDYLTYTKEPLHLIDAGSSRIGEIISTRQGAFDLNNFIYRCSMGDRKVNERDTLSVEFIAEISPGKFIRRTYRVPGGGFKLIQKTDLSGIQADLTDKPVEFIWDANIRNSEKDLKTSQMKTTINYYTSAGEFEDLKEASTEREEETAEGPVSWMAFKQKFFSNAIIAHKPFIQASFLTEIVSDPEIVKHTYFKGTQNVDDYQQGYVYYFGPNNYQILKKVAPGFSKNIYLGWPPVIWVNTFLIIPIFNWLENYISNYGIIIIILVLIVKIILLPLSYKSYISMAKTKVLKPELDAIKAEHGGDMQKAQAAQMKLYQQVGINPLSGCIPLLLQMPILFSMFYFFPNSIELRQEAFLWAEDLSTYDSIINLPFAIPFYGSHVSLFTILMTASTILYTWSTSQMTTVTGPMKTMQYIMPVMFMFILNSFPAALSFYYFVSNIITFGQQDLIRRFVNEDKIRLILEENKKKNATKKKSRFQERLEEAMKASEEARKKQKK